MAAKDKGFSQFKSLADQAASQSPTPPPAAPRPESKRNDPAWITRTYYVKKSTDIDLEEELARLRRQGIELDKSDLVNAALEAWIAYRKGAPPDTLKGVSPPGE